MRAEMTFSTLALGGGRESAEAEAEGAVPADEDEEEEGAEEEVEESGALGRLEEVLEEDAGALNFAADADFELCRNEGLSLLSTTTGTLHLLQNSSSCRRTKGVCTHRIHRRIGGE